MPDPLARRFSFCHWGPSCAGGASMKCKWYEFRFVFFLFQSSPSFVVLSNRFSFFSCKKLRNNNQRARIGRCWSFSRCLGRGACLYSGAGHPHGAPAWTEQSSSF